jgi:signal peptide peptidase SppA
MDDKNMKILGMLACEIISQPWAMLPEWLPKVVQTLSLVDPDLAIEKQINPMDALVQIVPDTNSAVINLNGALMKGAPDWAAAYGIINHDLAMSVIDELAGSAESVVFNINSPGGTVNGTPELADRIESLGRSGVTTIAYTDKLCASAGYHLASACEAIVSAPTARVGSIGTIRSFPTDKAAYEQMGIKWETFASAPLKAAGYPGRDLTGEEREFMQNQVDQSGKEFSSYVRARRKGISTNAFNGQAFEARFAPAGLVDRSNVATMKDLLKLMARGEV